VQVNSPQGIPLILNPGEVLSNVDNNYSNFNGLIVESTQEVNAITQEVNADPSYHFQVPSGKTLYVTSFLGNGGLAVIEDSQLGTISTFTGSPYMQSWILNSGDIMRSDHPTYFSSFSGYLVDENYFAGCGGSSSSTSNATIDSLSQVVSNLDSSLSVLTSLFNFGCTDENACTYDALANIDDGSCWGELGCMDALYLEYDGNALCDDGSCITLIVNGCMDVTACNYDVSANVDDGSCLTTYGCMDATACNYDASATCDDGSCLTAYGCMDATAVNYDASATCDDASCIAIAIGDTYEGGIVFYLDGNGGGLIAAPSDQSTDAEWGCTGTYVNGADGIAIGTGYQNTVDIYNAPCLGANEAADICYTLSLGGYNDWFLPSKDELNEMYLALHLLLLGGFDASASYWSSSEASDNYAWRVQFANGNWNDTQKGTPYNVRAIRAF
jgi:hypothetical protein